MNFSAQRQKAILETTPIGCKTQALRSNFINQPLPYPETGRFSRCPNGLVLTGTDLFEGGVGRFLNKKSSLKLTKTIDVTRSAASAA